MNLGSSASLPLLVFDGDCAFCSACVEWAERRIGRMPEVRSYQSFDPADLASLGLTVEACSTAVQYVARDHRVYAAQDAVSALLLGAGTGWWVLGALLRVPGIHWLAGIAYRWVARNRHRIKVNGASCQLPPP